MSNPDLGTKRVCPTTGRKFYDLNRDPIVSPYTGQSFPRSAFDPPPRGAAAAARARPVPAPQEEEAEPAVAEAEIVSLQDVEAPEDDKSIVDAEGDSEDEVALVEDEAADEAFIEEEEAGEDDVADLIDGDLKDDEET